MTRETKIGLLVGLAFIIVIGILLSDHLTSSTEPPQATLAVAGSNVRSAVTTPGARDNPPITRNVTPGAVALTETVPTPRDLAPHAEPVQPVQVAVGGPASLPPPAQPRAAAPEPVVQSPGNNDVATNDSGNTNARDDDAVITKAPPVEQTPQQRSQTASNQTQPGSNTTDIAVALRDAAKQHGEELVALGGSAQNGQGGTSAHPANMKQYVAVEGDTLSKLAGRFFGTNTKANRDLIVAANPSLKSDPNKILVGHSYNIPAATGVPASAGMTAQAPAPAAAPAQQAAQPVAQTQPPVVTANTNDNWYTVKDGDSLWKIATEECGGPAAIPAIRDLNKDTIKGDNVMVNTKIRLPNKVAMAN